MTVSEYEKLTALAKFAVKAQRIIDELEKQVSKLQSSLRKAQDAFDRLYEETKPFFEAMKLAPQRVKDLFSDIFQKAKEGREQEKSQRHGQTARQNTAGRDNR